MTIVFLEPDTMHPKSNNTIYDVAKNLENEFRLCEKFINYYKDTILKKLMSLCERQLKDFGYVNKAQVFQQLSEYIMFRWRDYIRRQEHGIMTKAAQKEGRKSFIDTKAYYMSMRVAIRD